MRSAPARESAPPRTDIPFDASIVPAAPVTPAPHGVAARALKGFGRWLKGAVITVGVMYVMIGFLLTFGIASLDSLMWRPNFAPNAETKTIIADAARPYGLAADPTITPARAGEAFAALRDAEAKPGKFTFRAVLDRPAAPWRTWGTLDPSLFPTAKPTGYNVPAAEKILQAVQHGFTPREKELLRQIGTAPIWKEYDLFARATAADLIGTRFELPFPSDATVFDMPSPRFAATKELAYASVARAAWHLSEGRRDSAEFALRATISFGRVLSDNAPFVIDQLIGNVITGIGRAGLVQFYALTGDPRGAALEATADKRAVAVVVLPEPINALGAGMRDLAGTRERLLAVATSPAVSRASRFYALEGLTISSCTNIRELVFGPSVSVRAAFDQAKRDLARYPGEVALIDLMAESLNRPEAIASGPSGELTPSRVMLLAGKAFFNPRLASCGLALTIGQRFNY